MDTAIVKLQTTKPLEAREGVLPRGYLAELNTIFILSGPLMIAQVSQMINGTIAIMFCGRLEKIQFDAATLANSMLNVFTQAVAIGLSGACDTLFSQIYGSKHRHRLGIVLIRSLIILSLCSTLPMAMNFNAEKLLILMGQEPEIARLARDYLLVSTPGVVAFFVYMPLVKYLQNQGVLIPCMFIGILANICNIVLHTILVIHLKYGLTGSAAAQATAGVSLVCMTLAYILISKAYKATWRGWSTESLLDWGQFFWLSLYGMIMTCIAWWAYELGLMLAGVLGTTELGAQSVVFATTLFTYLLPTGLSIAASIRVGQFLGANDPEGAAHCCKVLLSFTWFIGLVLAILLYFLRYEMAALVTDEQDVIDMAVESLAWYSLLTVFEGTHVVCGGILRGSGRQNIGSLVMCVSFIVALSIGLPLMMIHHSIKEFWQGMLIGIAGEAIVMGAIILKTDWIKQAQKAVERVSIGTETKMDKSSDEEDDYEDDDDDYDNVGSKLIQEEHPPMSNDEKGTDGIGRRVPVHVYLRTCFVILTMVTVLVAGVVCRIYVPIPERSVSGELNNGTYTNDKTLYGTNQTNSS